MYRFGQEGQRRRLAQHRPHAQLVRRAGGEVAPCTQHLAGLREGVDDQPGVDLRADRMQPELERGRHAEVAAAAAQGPEQLGLRSGRDLAQRAVGRHQAHAQQVVDGEAVLARQPAEAAAEREAGDAGGGIDSQRCGEAMRLRFAIEVGQQRARLDPRSALRRVDADLAHARHVEHQAALRDCIAGDMMAATPHAQQHVMRLREAHGGLHIARGLAARDQRGMPIDASVPDLAGFVVALVGLAEKTALQLCCECFDLRLAQGPDVLIQCEVRQ